MARPMPVRPSASSTPAPSPSASPARPSSARPARSRSRPAEEPHSNRFGREETRGLLVEADAGRVERLGEHAGVLAERASYRDERLAMLAWRLAGELRRRDAAAPLAIEGLLLEILAGAARERELRLTGARAPMARRRPRLPARSGARSRSLGELAAVVGRASRTLARGFRKAYGCSVGAYLRWLRVARAARRLAETDAPLAEIALAAGFADQSHFSNVFRRETGLSPVGVPAGRARAVAPRPRASALAQRSDRPPAPSPPAWMS